MRDVCIHGHGLDVVIGVRRARYMYDVCIYGVDGLDVVIHVRRARCMYDVCIYGVDARLTPYNTCSPSTPCMYDVCTYGVDGLHLVIGCETCEMYV